MVQVEQCMYRTANSRILEFNISEKLRLNVVGLEEDMRVILLK
jgi:hypothetical protein